MKAGAGIPLAIAQGKAGSDGSPGLAITTAPTKEVTVTQILRPNVRDRWLASQLSYFTPQIVENTFRGAMAGNLLAQWLLFDLMEQTWPRLSKNLNELKNAVIDLVWNLQPYAPKNKKPSAEAQRRAEIVEGLCWNMRPEADADESDFEDTLYDVMDAVGKGIEASEILWQSPGEEGNDTGLWRPRATRWVHPRYYGYAPQPGTEDRMMLNLMEVRMANPGLSQSGLYSLAKQAPTQLGWVPEGVVNGLYARFPKDQFIISIYKQKSGHPISGAMLRILGFWWAASNFAWEWFLNLAQIFGLPIRWGTYGKDANLATIQAIEDMMANLGSAGWAVFPEGTKLELFKALESARDNPSKAFIDAADIIADIVILGQTLTTSQGERGSQSLGTIHKSVRDEKIQAVAKRTAKVLNGQFLPAICRLNFGDDKECPWFQPSARVGKDLANTATRYKTILSIPGVTVSKQQFYEDNELIVPEGDEEVLVGQSNAGGAMPGDNAGDDGADESPSAALAKAATRTRHHAAAKATDKLAERVIENLTGVEAKWLAGVKPFFRDLVAKAKDESITDAEFVKVLERAQKEIGHLFPKLNTSAIADALEGALGAAVVNGAARGYLTRSGSRGRSPHQEVAK